MNAENWGNQSFENFLRERIKDDGFNLKKLSEQSGIAIKYLEAMISGNFEKLPAEPYFHGYIERLGRILDFDPDEWWGKLKESGAIDGGAHDLVTKNRFIKRPIPKTIWLFAVVIVILIYGGIRYSNIFGKPVLTLTYPQQNPATVSESQIVLAGTVKNGSELNINGESVPLGQSGEWQKSVLLQSGINSLEITAKKTLGGETKIIEQIIYAPAATLDGTD
jgi:cytoskeletal protein RodZ